MPSKKAQRVPKYSETPDPDILSQNKVSISSVNSNLVGTLVLKK